MSLSLWPCWSRRSRPDAFGWWTALFRLWISTLGYHQSRFFAVSNGFDLSYDDQHILRHLLPQVKVFVIELSDFNSSSRCWGHVLLELRFVDLVFFLSIVGSLFSSSFSYSSSSLNNNIALIPLVVDGALDVCGSVCVCVRVWIYRLCVQQTTQRIWQKNMKHILGCNSNGSSHYYVQEDTHYSVKLEIIY